MISLDLSRLKNNHNRWEIRRNAQAHTNHVTLITTDKNRGNRPLLEAFSFQY